MPERVAAERAHAALALAFEQVGAEAAALAASALLQAELNGHESFGLALLDGLVSEDDGGWEAALRPPETVDDLGALVILDATGRFGPVAVAAAAVEARRRAFVQGAGVVSVRGVGRLGRLAPYVEWLASNGVIGLICANAPEAVAPAGGTDPVIGTNPIGTALPVSGSEPIVVDTASSAITQAALRSARASGHPLPHGVAVDSGGAVTTDPDRVHAILPRGGVLGSSIALIAESLSGGVSGVSPLLDGGRAVTIVAIRAAPAAGDVGAALSAAWEDARGHVPGSGTVAWHHSPDAVVPVTPALRWLVQYASVDPGSTDGRHTSSMAPANCD